MFEIMPVIFSNKLPLMLKHSCCSYFSWAFTSCYKAINGKACNAIFVLMARLFGVIFTTSATPTAILLKYKDHHTPSGKQEEKVSQGDLKNIDFFEPVTTNPKLDYLDLYFCKVFARGWIMHTVLTICICKYIPAKILKYFSSWIIWVLQRTQMGMFSIKTISFLVCRTIGVDAFMRWALLCGGEESFAHLCEITAKDEENPNSAEDRMATIQPERYLNMHFTVDTMEQGNNPLPHKYRNGVKQVVILGAGYEARPYKFRYLRAQMGMRMGLEGNNKASGSSASTSASVPVFEVDMAWTQEAKLECLKTRLTASERMIFGDNVTYVCCNLITDDLMTKLLDAGFKQGVDTAIIFEGVSYYIGVEAFYRSLHVLSKLIRNSPYENSSQVGAGGKLKQVGKISPKGCLLFDYLQIPLDSLGNLDAEPLHEYLSAMGISFISHLNVATLENDISKTGWRLVSHWDYPKLEADSMKILLNFGELPKAATGTKFPFGFALCQI